MGRCGGSISYKRSSPGRRAVGAALVVALTTLVHCAAGASTVTLRSPQVYFDAGSLQALLDAHAAGVDVTTEQYDVANWATPLGNCGVTLHPLRKSVEQALSLYDTAWPAVAYPLLPPGSDSSWSCYFVFRPGHGLEVVLFDGNQYQFVTYAGADSSHFGFLLTGPAAPGSAMIRSTVAPPRSWRTARD